MLDLVFSHIAVFPDLSHYFDEFNVIKTDRSEGQSYKNKTQAAINCPFSFNNSEIKNETFSKFWSAVVFY